MQVTFRPRLCDQAIREEAVRLLCRSEELRLHELERVTKAEGNRKGGEQEGLVSFSSWSHSILLIKVE